MYVFNSLWSYKHEFIELAVAPAMSSSPFASIRSEYITSGLTSGIGKHRIIKRATPNPRSRTFWK